MEQSENVVRVPGRSALTYPQAQRVHTTYDSFGAVVADYTFFPHPHVLYVRWYGNVTGDELARAAHTGLRLTQQWQPQGLFQDLRSASGEWGEGSGSAWIEHEWIPGIQAKCLTLRGIAVLLDAEAPQPYANTQMLAHIGQQFDFQIFYSCLSAWQWLEQRTQP
jgi:hypothetical protein